MYPSRVPAYRVASDEPPTYIHAHLWISLSRSTAHVSNQRACFLTVSCRPFRVWCVAHWMSPMCWRSCNHRKPIPSKCRPIDKEYSGRLALGIQYRDAWMPFLLTLLFWIYHISLNCRVCRVLTNSAHHGYASLALITIIQFVVSRQLLGNRIWLGLSRLTTLSPYR